MKTLILLRHSIPDKTGASGLSPAGVEKARLLFRDTRFRSVSRVWVSPAPRAVETAALLGLPVTQDARLAERRTGDTTGQGAAFWARQYTDPDFKNPDGESFHEVRARMDACIQDVLAALPEGGTALVVSHAAAICSWLMGFCTVEVTDAERKLRRITFRQNVVLNGSFEPATGFVVRWKDGEIEGIHLVCLPENDIIKQRRVVP